MFEKSELEKDGIEFVAKFGLGLPPVTGLLFGTAYYFLYHWNFTSLNPVRFILELPGGGITCSILFGAATSVGAFYSFQLFFHILMHTNAMNRWLTFQNEW